MSRWPATALALLIAAVPLAGCETTQDKARAIQEAGAEQLQEAQFRLGQPSKDVKVLNTTLLHDENGDAIVVEVENTSNQTLVNVPILVDLRDPKGKSVYKNDIAGLEPTLNHIPVLKPGESFDWVNDQLSPTVEPKSAKVTVGTSDEKAPAHLPALEVSAPSLTSNPVTGIEVEGRVTNNSKLDQKKLVLFAVSRSGGRIVAAGRGQIKNLKVGARPGPYNIFFIGDPRGGEIAVKAPPSVLQ